MKTFWLNLLWTLVKRIIGDQELLSDLRDLVVEAFSWNMNGEAKRAAVKAKLAELGHDLAEIGESLVNLAIEAALALARAKMTRDSGLRTQD